MNRFKLLAFLFAALIVTTLSSCGKDDDAAPSRKALLTAKQWQGNRILIDNQDFTSFFNMDNTAMTFNTNGTYLIKLDGDTDNGTWEFTSNEQKLLMDKGTSHETNVDILKLTNEALNIKWVERDSDSGESYTVELQLVRD